MHHPVNSFLSPSRRSGAMGLGIILGLQAGASHGQNPMVPALPGETTPNTSYFQTTLPMDPWDLRGTEAAPDWVGPNAVQSPFLQPGLGTSSIGASSITSVSGAGAGRTEQSRFPIGPLDLSARMSYDLNVADGVSLNPGLTQQTIQHTLSTGLILRAGQHWSISYAPSVYLYSSGDFDNRVEHSIGLSTWASMANWRYTLSHGTSLAGAPLVETATQTGQTTHATGVSAQWMKSQTSTLLFSLSQSIRITDAFTDNYSWMNDNSWDQKVSDILSLGLITGFGYDLVEPGSDIIRQRLSARVRSSIGEKTSWSLSGGAEFAEFTESSADMRVSPLLGVTINYQALERTSAILRFDHSVGTSYFANQFTQNTSADLTILQILSSRWSISGGGGYRLTTYLSTQSSNDSQREDGTLFVQTAVNWQAMSRMAVSFSYSYRSNDSDVENFAQNGSQIGFRVNYLF